MPDDAWNEINRLARQLHCTVETTVVRTQQLVEEVARLRELHARLRVETLQIRRRAMAEQLAHSPAFQAMLRKYDHHATGDR